MFCKDPIDEDQQIQNYVAYKVIDLSIASPFIFFASCMWRQGGLQSTEGNPPSCSQLRKK